MTAIKRKPLLTTNNAKTIKGEKLGYLTYILYMSPFKANSLGKNVCSHASKGCIESCLVGSGNGGMFEGVKKGRIAKTDYFLSFLSGRALPITIPNILCKATLGLEDPPSFIPQLALPPSFLEISMSSACL